MKLRMAGNTIRLRLKPSEVAQLETHGVVQERVDFGPSELTYSLRTSSGATAIGATFRNGNIEVTLPESMAKHWAASREVSLEGTENALFILVEKDFRCMHQDERDTDVYPHPMVVSEI